MARPRHPVPEPVRTDPTRRTAVAVGVLFLAATGLYLAGQAIYDPILGSAEYLELAHPQRTRVIVGVLVELAGIVAIPLIAAFLYPVLRPDARALAVAYLALRLLEAVALVVADVDMLSLLEVSRGYLYETGAGAAQWENLGSVLHAHGQWAFLVSVGLFFPLGSLVLNAVLLRTRLVPRFIAGWGLFGASLLLAGSLLVMLGVFDAAPQTALEIILTGPIALQEVVLALWLIAKGFRVPGGEAAGAVQEGS